MCYMPYIKVCATNEPLSKSSYTDDKEQSREVYNIGVLRDFYLTEYAHYSRTGWYALKPDPGGDPSRDDYVEIIRINDLCVYDGKRVLYTREDRLPENIYGMIDNYKSHE